MTRAPHISHREGGCRIRELADVTVRQVADLLGDRQITCLRDILSELNATDVADIMQQLYEEEALPPEDFPFLFRILSKDMAADVFVEMDYDLQEELIRSFSDRELADVMNDLFADDAKDIIEEMPANVVKRILRSISPDLRRDVNALLNYPDDSAGSIMTTEYVSLKKDMTVQQAFARIRQTGVDKETIYTCYVTDPSTKLDGLVSVKDLLLSDMGDTIENVMTTSIILCHTLDDREDVAQMFLRYDFDALPVVDNENRLVGIVTVDDAITVLQEEATEDMEKMAAITPSDKPYLKTSVLDIWKSRVPWLLVLMISAAFTGMIITRFESALSKAVALTAFIPMLMNTGGNSGSQASVTIIRGLSLGDIEFSDMATIIWKEIRVALLCGLALGAANFAKLMLFDQTGLPIALVVSITLVVTVPIAKVVGCTLPMIAKKIGFDPAVMASPFISTIVDAVALLCYFRVATMILNI